MCRAGALRTWLGWSRMHRVQRKPNEDAHLSCLVRRNGVDPSTGENPSFEEVGVNSFGVAVSSTETIESSEAALAFDPLNNATGVSCSGLPGQAASRFWVVRIKTSPGGHAGCPPLPGCTAAQLLQTRHQPCVHLPRNRSPKTTWRPSSCPCPPPHPRAKRRRLWGKPLRSTARQRALASCSQTPT